MICPSLLIILIIAPYFSFSKKAKANEDGKMSSCEVCEKTVENFLKGLNDTANKTYDSGSREWEKAITVSYDKSEIRYLEIMKNICENITEFRKCHILVEKNEQALEDWFYHTQYQNESLYDSFCITSAQVCCPKNHFGKTCEICPGFINDTMCGGKGDCMGDGTRRGNGTCICEKGYTGPTCQECGESSYRDSNSNGCIPCHNSCNGKCLNHTVEGCLGGCKSGWSKDENDKCQDINECASSAHNCTKNQYCLNVPGKFHCRDCHETCETCNGDQPHNCLTCKKGYEKNSENKCVEIDECADNSHNCKPGQYCLNKEGGYSCKKCSSACKGECDGPGPEGCLECSEGYVLSESGKGCEDINECETNPNICPPKKYCKNKNGSYKCKKCDEACAICHGVGPYSCLSCSDGYKMVSGVCKDTKEADSADSQEEDDDL